MKKLKVTLIGYGYWGKKLARNFQNSENFVLTSISDSKRKNLIAAKKNYPLAKLYKDFKKSVKFQSSDLVVISTPTVTHFKICKFALQNSKNVLVEKPISLSSKKIILPS